MAKRPVSTLALAGLLTLALPLAAADYTITARVSFFRPSDADFRGLYGSGLMWGAEFSAGISERIALWVDADYFSRRGELSRSKEEIRIRMVPLSAGVSYRLGISGLEASLGAGLIYCQYRETSPIGTVEKGNLGFVGKLGTRVKLGLKFILDLEAAWSRCRAKPLDVAADLGGFRAGAGLGFQF